VLLLTHIVSLEYDRRVRKQNNIDICKYKSSMIQISLALTLYVIMSGILSYQLAGQLSVFEAFYFCFIAFTTIGFGDIVYDSKVTLEKPVVYTISLLVFLIGMATVASTISAISEVLQKKSFSKWFKEKRSTLRKSKNSQASKK